MERERAIAITKEMWSRIAEIEDFSNSISITGIKQDALSNMLEDERISSQEVAVLEQNYDCAFCTLYLDSDCVDCPGQPLWGKPEDNEYEDDGMYALCESSIKSPYRKIHQVFDSCSIHRAFGRYSTSTSYLYEMSELIREWAKEIAEYPYK
jgi:hypothetical protein